MSFNEELVEQLEEAMINQDYNDEEIDEVLEFVRNTDFDTDPKFSSKNEVEEHCKMIEKIDSILGKEALQCIEDLKRVKVRMKEIQK